MPNSNPNTVILKTKHTIKLELDNLVMDIEYCRLENIRFEPKLNSFQFTNGKWQSQHNNFPIDSDNDLDLMIIVTGNPGTTPMLKVSVDNKPPGVYPSQMPFSSNGRTYFNLHITIPNS